MDAARTTEHNILDERVVPNQKQQPSRPIRKCDEAPPGFQWITLPSLANRIRPGRRHRKAPTTLGKEAIPE